MWRPPAAVRRHALTAAQTRSLPLVNAESVRRVSDTTLEARKHATKSGWWSRRGTHAGHPYTNVQKMRVTGIDKNLQERLDEMYASEREAFKGRRNIGLPKPRPVGQEERQRQMEFRKHQRKNKDLERAARLNLLQVDVDEVKAERVKSGALFDDLVDAADLYGIFEDLYGADAMFRPRVHLRVLYDRPGDDDHVMPVHRGNVIKPREAKSAPEVEFNDDEDEASLWTLVMSNPDGHLSEDDAECLHWMVANVPSDGDLAKGETVCPYLQPFPPHGTGFHRFVFVLYKQAGRLDASRYRQPEGGGGGVDLEARTFRSGEFLEAMGGAVAPAGLAFFQSDHDDSLHGFFHSVLNVREPRFEYNFADAYVQPWSHQYENRGSLSFNLFLDRFRSPKSVQEEVLKKRLKTLHPFRGDLDDEVKYPNAHHPRAFNMRFITEMGSWRVREIERERLRRGLFKHMDHFDARRDPSNA